MTINKVSASQGQQILMEYVAAVIQQVTLTSPMSVEDIVSVLGVCCGAAIANGKSTMSRRDLRQLVMMNIDNAMQTADSMPKPSGLILPPGMG